MFYRAVVWELGTIGDGEGGPLLIPPQVSIWLWSELTCRSEAEPTEPLIPLHPYLLQRIPHDAHATQPGGGEVSKGCPPQYLPLSPTGFL